MSPERPLIHAGGCIRSGTRESRLGSLLAVECLDCRATGLSQSTDPTDPTEETQETDQ